MTKFPLLFKEHNPLIFINNPERRFGILISGLYAWVFGDNLVFMRFVLNSEIQINEICVTMHNVILPV